MPRWDAVRDWATPERRRGIGVGLLVGVAVLVLRWYVRNGAAPLFWNDSADYVAAARASLWSTERLIGTRPILLPMAISAASNDLERLAVWQAWFAALAWGSLAAAASVSVRSTAARVVVAVGVLALASTWTVSMWDQQILTESLALSSLALCVAAAIWFSNRPSGSRAVVLVLTAALWLAARDSHAIPVGLAALAVLVWAWRGERARRRLVAVTGAYLLALSFLVVSSASAGDRNLLPLEHVYAVRILPFPERTAWFADHGMPQADELLAVPEAVDVEGRNAPFTPIAPTAQWAPWRRWLRDHGQSALLRYALEHPSYAIGETQRSPERVFNNGEGLATYEPLDRRTLPGLDAVAALPTPWVVAVALGALAGLWRAGRLRRRLSMVGVVVIATALPHALAVWHLDGMESARHLLIPGVQLRIGALLLLAASADLLADRLRGTGRSPRARSTDRPRALGPRRA